MHPGGVIAFVGPAYQRRSGTQGADDFGTARQKGDDAHGSILVEAATCDHIMNLTDDAKDELLQAARAPNNCLVY